MTTDVAIITCYYNPQRYRTKRENYEEFLGNLRRINAPVVVMELAIGDAEFDLPDAPWIRRVRGKDVLWQKERLLNLLLDDLSETFTKVAWLDCDLLFEDPLWLARTSIALDSWPVVQPFSEVVRLPRGQREYAGAGEKYPAFGLVCSGNPECVRAGDFASHGHTGFAWAARREALAQFRFYDACLTGSGDHLMAHGMSGDWESPCVANMVGQGRYREHFIEWAKRASAVARGNIGAVPGRVLHLWHGNFEERRYFLRNRQFQHFDFDPWQDVRLSDTGVWEWATAKPALHQWTKDFFASRNEDGVLEGSIVQLLSTRRFG